MASAGGSGRGQGPDPGLPRQRPGPHCHWRRDHCHEDEKVSCETGKSPSVTRETEGLILRGNESAGENEEAQGTERENKKEGQ